MKKTKGVRKAKSKENKRKKAKRWALRRASKYLLINMIFALEEKVVALEERVMTDILTGLKTRRYFKDECERLLKGIVRSKGHVSVLFIDIDHFKRVNDTLGHEAGDDVLRRVAETLTKHVRPLDTVARWGGEEIVVSLPNATESQAHVSAERLRKAVSEITFPQYPDLKVTVSVGVASTAISPFGFDHLLFAADKAMYAAKHSGRNKVVCFGDFDK